LTRLAVTLQFTLPGVPVIYYGEENGMEGGNDPANRAPMVWDEAGWHPGIRAHTKTLIALRRARPELRRGRFVNLTAHLEPPDANVIAFYRATDTPGEFSLALVNRDNRRRTATFFVPYAHLYGGLQLMDILGGHKPVDAAARLAVTLEPQAAALYVPQETRLPHFHFYKGR
ncbi:MAG: hypothetical protein JO250_04665, partial [Armatimonadetes bacterium]|nr:hypothetical protein [Armatimonadota bacterium]